MKILILSQGLPFPIYRDGLTIRVFHLLKEFASRAQCHLVAFSEYDLSNEELLQLRKMCTYHIVPHNPQRGVLGTARKILSSRRYYSEEFRDSIRFALNHQKPDIIFAEQTFIAQYADLFNEYPSVMSAVDAISLAALRQADGASNRLGRLTWKYVARQRLAIERKYFPKFDAVTAVAEEDADFLRKNAKVNIEVIPNGVDTEHFNPIAAGGARVSVIFSGNLNAMMNEEAALYLLESVYPFIHERRPDLTLVIAGRGVTSRLRVAIPAYVALREDVPDMREALSDGLIYLSPIAHGTGIKNNVLQAMAMGIPVVTTKLIADPIAVVDGETGFVMERGVDLGERIVALLDEDDVLRRVGASGRQHVESNYSWSGVAEKYFNIFNEVLGIK